MSRKDAKLTKNRDEAMIAGVCAGLADYYDTDATLVRAIFIAASVVGGFGPALYIVLWILLDDADPEPPTSALPPSTTAVDSSYQVDSRNRSPLDSIDTPPPPLDTPTPSAPPPDVPPAEAADRTNQQNNAPRS